MSTDLRDAMCLDIANHQHEGLRPRNEYEYIWKSRTAANDKANARGSFPLDHDGECKEVMTNYLACMKKVRGVNQEECRALAKSYLTCRMDNNLMAKDDFKNLGFAQPEKEPEKGVKGELHW